MTMLISFVSYRVVTQIVGQSALSLGIVGVLRWTNKTKTDSGLAKDVRKSEQLNNSRHNANVHLLAKSNP